MRTFKFLALVALVCGLSVAVGTARSGDAKEAAKCPISGKPTKGDVFLEINGQKQNLCCKGCVDPYKKKIGLVTPEKLVCPFSGKPANPDHTLIEKTVEKRGICCKGCLEPFAKKNKFVKKDKKPGKCPISGKPASAEVFLAVNGNNEYFCCPGCIKGYTKKLAVQDKSEKCAISGKKANPALSQIHVKYTVKGFCCGDCKSNYTEKNFKDGVYIGHIKEKAKRI